MYYLQSRYYNPEWGRFINADAFISTGQGILGNNMFAYCMNNPVNGYDSSGYACIMTCHGDINLLFRDLSDFGCGGGGAGSKGGYGGTRYSNFAEKISNNAQEVLDAYSQGYLAQQKAKEQEAKMMVEAAMTIYAILNETGVVAIGKVGYKSYKAANEFNIAMAYLYAPIPTLIDEVFAAGHAIKGFYHLYGSIEEMFE